MTKRILLVGMIFSLLWGCQAPVQQAEEKQTPKRPKNVIFLIGDGMGLSQVSSSFFYNDNKPNFERFNNIGFVKTSSSSHKITDSAAGATAYSAGVKSYNGAMGVGADTAAVTTILEIASEQGLSSGLVATSSITHATPGSFFSHVKSRQLHEEIAAYLPTSAVDFFAAGGLEFFSKRKDGLNYYDSLIENGFIMDSTKLERPAELLLDKKYGYLLADDGMPKMQEGRGDFLPNATQMALDYLSQDEKGFFLMVEGSQIDWGGHANDAEYIIHEVIDFDKTIGKVLDFAEKDGNTLVVVTADHETGGFTLAGKKKVKPFGLKYDDYDDIDPSFSTGGHSATLIPVFAFGPGSDDFRGIYENTEVFHKALKAAQWSKAAN
ncbi:alkaline phosphatase [Rapidithrix thailandica]|uniref:Alkaline phosphatase n=1 Tax=Rapidithrix thailandica TaxID=413964 RepID=A0AAW9S882_9BACT